MAGPNRTPPQVLLSPNERSEFARHAARVRWSRERRRYMARLRQAQETFCKGYVEASQELARHPSASGAIFGHALRRLVSGFSNLCELTGVLLPLDLAAEIGAHVQRIVREVKGRPDRRRRTM